MIWVYVLFCAFVCSQGLEVPRGSRIRFPYDGPSSPFSSDKSLNTNRFGDIGTQQFPVGAVNKPYINHHRSPPSSLREGQLHEIHPPPFGSQGPKAMGVLSAPPPPSMSSILEGESSQRHRFVMHRDPNFVERHPTGPRHPPHGMEGHPPPTIHYDKHPMNERHPRPPPMRDDKHNDGGERHRPDRPPVKGGDRYHNQERYPGGHPEKLHVYKEKPKMPFSVNKKPLFNPTPTEEGFPLKTPPRLAPTPSQLLAEYAQPTPEQDDSYFQAKLNEEYYSGMQRPQFAEMPMQMHSQNPPNLQLNSPPNPMPTPNFNNPFDPDAVNLPNYGKINEVMNIPNNEAIYPANTFPQSEELGKYFEKSLPEWMNKFKVPPAEPHHNPAGSVPAIPLHKGQEAQRAPNKQPQHFNMESQSFDQRPNKFVNKRNPFEHPTKQGYFDEREEGDEQYYHESQIGSFANPSPKSDSSYDFQETSEYDFDASSDLNDHDDYNKGSSFNYGSTSKSTGTEWIPINAPNGAVPAKSYDISAPDLSRDAFQSQSSYGGGYQNVDSARRPATRVEKSRGSTNSNVVYGARDKGRQNEGVVSASVMVNPY